MLEFSKTGLSPHLGVAWTGLLLIPRSAGTDANFPLRALDRKNHSLGDSDGGKDYVRAFSAKQRLEPHLDFTFEVARFGTGSDTNTGCAWLNEFIPKFFAGIAVPFTETATVCGVSSGSPVYCVKQIDIDKSLVSPVILCALRG
jgi:hypothetical protein